MQATGVPSQPTGHTLRIPLDARFALIGLQFTYFAALPLFSVAVLHGRIGGSMLYAPALYVAAVVAAWRWRPLSEWLPVIGLALAYLALRDVPLELDPFKRSEWLADSDQIVGGGSVPSVTLQDHLYRPGLNWLNVITTLAYLQHFPAPAIAIIIFSRINRRIFWTFGGALLLVTLAGFFSYVVFPVAPPWLASEQAQLPAVDRTVLDTLRHILPDELVSWLWDTGDVYPVGAFPSIHAAWPLLVTIVWLPYVRQPWRPVLLLYPLLVGFALVYSSEHYATDVLAGWALALTGYLAVALAFRRGLILVSGDELRAGNAADAPDLGAAQAEQASVE